MSHDPQDFIRARNQESLTEWAGRLKEKADSCATKGFFGVGEVEVSRFASRRQIVLLWLREAITGLADAVADDPTRENIDRLRWTTDFYRFLQEGHAHSIDEAVALAGEPVYHDHLHNTQVQFPTDPESDRYGEEQEDADDPKVQYNDLFSEPALHDVEDAEVTSQA